MNPATLLHLEETLIELRNSLVEIHNAEREPVVQTHIGHAAELAFMMSMVMAEARVHLEEKEALDS